MTGIKDFFFWKKWIQVVTFEKINLKVDTFTCWGHGVHHYKVRLYFFNLLSWFTLVRFWLINVVDGHQSTHLINLKKKKHLVQVWPYLRSCKYVINTKHGTIGAFTFAIFNNIWSTILKSKTSHLWLYANLCR